MYGVSEELMQRMQKRMREKIYREMIEEEHKYKGKFKERNKGKHLIDSRLKTEPNHPSRQEANSREDYLNGGTAVLKEESTFLPVIQARSSPSQNETQGTRRNPEYLNYVNRRQKRMKKEEHPQQRRSSASAALAPSKPSSNRYEEGEDEDEDKAEEYINQCEQIINNLRELTNKNKHKLKERENKYEDDHQKYSPKNKSFSGNAIGDFIEYKGNTFTPKSKDFSALPTSISNHRNADSSANSIRFTTPIEPSYSLSNEFNEFSDLAKSKSRVNSRKISVTASPKVNDLDTKILTAKSTQIQNLKSKQNFKRLSPLPNPAEDNEFEEEVKEQTNEQNEPQEEAREENKNKKKSSKEQLNSENKRQKAIVKYLKKARLRGNLLYQKIESHKPQNESQPDPNENNSDPNGNQPPPNKNPPNGNPPNPTNPPPGNAGQGGNQKQL